LNEVNQNLKELIEMDKVKDTVCGMEVEKDKAITTSYKAKTYYFCSEACKNKFEEKPTKYVSREDSECY
jgi:YHS domain-containing protein